METTINPTTDPAELREAMVSTLTDADYLRTPAIIGAFRHIERHRFIPGTDPQDAYIDDAVSIKHDAVGEIISSIFAPSIVATQLEQLGAQPGHKILEAGAATGYDPALLAHLAPRLARCMSNITGASPTRTSAGQPAWPVSARAVSAPGRDHAGHGRGESSPHGVHR
ncbi:hypothetical protein [Actinomadura formosensis]|uniref:hypothetical protein n=1 Tax=Actinomadura formosensis TaxID=60706 RepID=UPI003D8E47CC